MRTQVFLGFPVDLWRIYGGPVKLLPVWCTLQGVPKIAPSFDVATLHSASLASSSPSGPTGSSCRQMIGIWLWLQVHREPEENVYSVVRFDVDRSC